MDFETKILRRPVRLERSMPVMPQLHDGSEPKLAGSPAKKVRLMSTFSVEVVSNAGRKLRKSGLACKSESVFDRRGSCNKRL